jgi:Na+-driven multidrug efflux pump
MTENPLGYEKIPKLLKNFAVPSIVASLVGSIYNIVDQIFIGQGVGYLGNAATNVAYPFSTICLAIALLVGIGSASRVSLCLGRKEPKAAAKAAGNGIVLMGIFGIIYLLVGETFLSLLLKAFGATTDVFPYAKQYASITLIGMPFLIVTNGMSNLIRADGKPKYSMVCMVVGAIINTILDPIFIFVCDWGIAGAAWATVIGQIFSFILALRYLWRFQTIHFEKESFLLDIKESMKICSMGISSS